MRNSRWVSAVAGKNLKRLPACSPLSYTRAPVHPTPSAVKRKINPFAPPSTPLLSVFFILLCRERSRLLDPLFLRAAASPLFRIFRCNVEFCEVNRIKRGVFSFSFGPTIAIDMRRFSNYYSTAQSVATAIHSRHVFEFKTIFYLPQTRDPIKPANAQWKMIETRRMLDFNLFLLVWFSLYIKSKTESGHVRFWQNSMREKNKYSLSLYVLSYFHLYSLFLWKSNTG